MNVPCITCGGNIEAAKRGAPGADGRRFPELCGGDTRVRTRTEAFQLAALASSLFPLAAVSSPNSGVPEGGRYTVRVEGFADKAECADLFVALYEFYATVARRAYPPPEGA